MTGPRQLDLEQGSQEWKAWRRTKLTASVAAVVMACAPAYWGIRTPEELRRWRAGEWEPPEPDAFTKKLWSDGHRIENEIRGGYNDGWHAFYPTIFERGEFGASLDGWDDNTGEWLEVKSPKDAGSVAYRMATNGEFPDYYLWQLVHQAHVVPDGATNCRYVVAPADGAPPSETVIPREELLARWPELEAAWTAFRDVEPNLPPDSDEGLAVEYLAALREHDHAKERLDRAKAKLLAAGPRTIPELVEISQSSVRGKINWQAVARDAGVDDKTAEEYRAEASTRTSIKLLASSA